MADLNFGAALDFIWRPENDGQAAHTTPGDSGGLTAWGATYRNYCAFLARVGASVMSPDMFAALPHTAFLEFYRKEYWQAARCNYVPDAVALMLFDAAVMSGPANAARMLQSAVSADPDGIIGPLTLAAVFAAWHRAPAGLLVAFYAARCAFYAEHANPAFINGWRRRAKDCLVAADDLLPPPLSTPETRLAGSADNPGSAARGADNPGSAARGVDHVS